MNRIKVDGNPSLIRDAHSKAVLVTDKKQLIEHREKRWMQNSLYSLQDDINSLKQQINELKTIINNLQNR